MILQLPNSWEKKFDNKYNTKGLFVSQRRGVWASMNTFSPSTFNALSGTTFGFEKEQILLKLWSNYIHTQFFLRGNIQEPAMVTLLLLYSLFQTLKVVYHYLLYLNWTMMPSTVCLDAMGVLATWSIESTTRNNYNHTQGLLQKFALHRW